MIEINDILTARDNSHVIEGIVRVVAVAEDLSRVALMRLDIRPLTAPYVRSYSSSDPDVASNMLTRLEIFDVCLPATVSSLSVNKREKLRKISSIMEDVLNDSELILDPEYRGRILKKIANNHQLNVRTIRRYLYDYLWGGMVELAFLGPQKSPNTKGTKQRLGTKKRGAKPVREGSGSHLPLPEVRENLEKGVMAYYQAGKLTEMEAYVATLRKFYSLGKKATRLPGEKVLLEDILLPSEQCPSFRQFHYMVSLLIKNGNKRIAPRPVRQPREKKVRKDSVKAGVKGPGYRYEIDATRVQNRIVSRFDPEKLLREATLYSIIDVWSGAIVGYALSLESAGWSLAAKALLNCFTSKDLVFDRLGLPYEKKAWVSQHLPSRLAADRGEFVGNKAGVVPDLGIKLEIMPSMRPDRKGSVEGKFEDIKYSDNFYLKPGKHDKHVPRRGNDGKKHAALTLAELESIIVEIILDLNNEPVPVANLPVEAVNAGIDAVTYGGLFEWGLEHRSGFTRKLEPKLIKSELMVRGMASVTPKGLNFKQNNYHSGALRESGLLEQSVTRGHFKIDIRYDDLAGDKIYYLDPCTQSWIAVFNDNPDVQRLNASFWEIEEYLAKANQLHHQAKLTNINNKAEKAKRINANTQKAIKRSKTAKKTNKAAQSKPSIRETTSVEIAAEQSRRLSEEQKSILEAKMKPLEEKQNQTMLDDPDADTNELQVVGQRTLEIWKKLNGDMD